MAKPQYLTRGGESREGLDILLSFTNITSENFKGAFYDHFIVGHNRAVACLFNDYDEGNFSTRMDIINDVAKRVEEYNKIKRNL